MTNPNDPITPINKNLEGFDSKHLKSDGLTKREYFAAMAMQGLINISVNLPHFETPKEQRDYLTHTAKLIADAMIAELNKDNKNKS